MILAFDGVCVLCNGFVRFLIARDHHRRIRFTTNLSETGAALFAQSGQDAGAPNSVILADSAQLYRQSDAALRAIAALGGGWRMVRGLAVVPRPLRDAIYQLVARNRYRLFGKYETCPLIPAEWQERFLP